jgi:putative transposase
MEMYLQGVSTRKVKAVTEELCGHEFSSATISRMVQPLDGELEKFARRRLEEAYPYLILDARYEKVREDGAVRSQAVLVAIGVNWEGRRCMLGVELANRESNSSWKELLKSLRQRGLHGVEFVVSDDHAGLRRAIQEVLPEAVWQRCYVHFLRNALDYLPRKADDDCLMELRWIYDRRNLEEARQDVVAWLAKWSKRYPKLCDWVEENIEETLSFYRLPRQHHKHLKSTNMLERLMEEIKRRTLVVRIFPNVAACLRRIRTALCSLHRCAASSPPQPGCASCRRGGAAFVDWPFHPRNRAPTVPCASPIPAPAQRCSASRRSRQAQAIPRTAPTAGGSCRTCRRRSRRP